MTHKQKIIGIAAVGFLVTALVISMAPDTFLYRNAETSSSVGYDSYASIPPSGGSTKAYDMRQSEADYMHAEGSPTVAPIEFGQKIIKNGSLTMQVASIDAATASIRQIATSHGGDVVSETFSQYSPSVPGTQSIILKVASSDFDAAMEACKALAQEISYQNVSTEDVTSAYIDLEARLNNAYAEEASYVAVLAKATSVEDILKVQDYLSRVRGNIESMEAQKKYLDGQTSFSTIEINLSEDERVTLSDDSFRPWQAVVNAIQTVIEGFQAFLIGLIQFVIIGGAILIPLAIIGFIVRAIIRHFHKS